MSKLPAPSVSMPCDYRILQSPTKEQVLLVLWETVGRSILATPISINRHGTQKRLVFNPRYIAVVAEPFMRPVRHHKDITGYIFVWGAI